MTYLDKCLELAEDYTVKKQRFNLLLSNNNKSVADLKKAEKEKEEARQRYISFISNFSSINLHENVLL